MARWNVGAASTNSGSKIVCRCSVWRKSNDCVKRGLGLRSPNPVLANFLAVMEWHTRPADAALAVLFHLATLSRPDCIFRLRALRRYLTFPHRKTFTRFLDSALPTKVLPMLDANSVLRSKIENFVAHCAQV